MHLLVFRSLPDPNEASALKSLSVGNTGCRQTQGRSTPWSSSVASFIEQLLENWQQKDPERSQRGAGNRVAVSEQRILVKFVATVQIVERIAPHGSRMAVLAEQEASTPWTLR